MIGFYAFIASVSFICGVLSTLVVRDLWLPRGPRVPRVKLPKARVVPPDTVRLGRECIKYLAATGAFRTGGRR